MEEATKLTTPLMGEDGHRPPGAAEKGDDLGISTMAAMTDSSSSSSLFSQARTNTSCFRRLFRKKVATIESLGLLVQVLSFLIFILMTTEKFIVHAYEDSCEDIYTFRTTATFIFIAVWFGLGCVHEYALLLGGAFYIRWGGWTCVMAPILHLTLGLISIWRSIMQHRYIEGNASCHATLITVYVLCFGLYLAVFKSNVFHLKQLAAVYRLEGCDTSFSKDTLRELLSEAIIALELDDTIHINDIQIEEVNGKKEFADLIESISSQVSMFNMCRRSKLSSSQFRDLSRELLFTLQEKAKMQDVELGSSGSRRSKRKIPLSWFEVTMGIFRKWLFAPKQFVLTLLTVAALGSVNPVQSIFMGKFIDNSSKDNTREATISLIVWASLFAVETTLNSLLGFAVSRLNAEAMRVCRMHMLKVVLSSGTAFSDVFQQGAIVDAFTSQMGRVEVILINTTYTLLRCSLQLTMSVIIAARIDPLISVLFISMMPVMFSVDKLARLALKSSTESSFLEGKLASQFMSLVDCLPVIRSCHVGNWVFDRFDAPLKDHFNARKRTILRSHVVQTYYQACGFAYTAVVVVPWGLLCSTGMISTGEFTSLVQLTAGMIDPLSKLGGFMRTATNYSGSMSSVDNLLKQGHLLQEEAKALGVLGALGTGIEIKNLRFRYSESSPDILKGINLEIQRGTYVAICGSSGSGKSTLLELLMRNRLPQDGTIEWDGFNVFDATLASFRTRVGVMFQRTMIIHGTIGENISFGLEPNDADIEKAAKMAEIEGVINALPNGYDTILGDGTTGLSGGQLQRICLARVLYRKPSVLMLDEATSALDPISEAAIIQTILNLRDTEGLTIVSVTHHPSTTVEAEKIVVLHNGIVVEAGTYQELNQLARGYFIKMSSAGESVSE